VRRSAQEKTEVRQRDALTVKMAATTLLGLTAHGDNLCGGKNRGNELWRCPPLRRVAAQQAYRRRGEGEVSDTWCPMVLTCAQRPTQQWVVAWWEDGADRWARYRPQLH
jgi:hypothetical protein